MRVLFLAVFIIGLGLGVVSMIAGIDRDQRHGRWVRYINLPTVGAAATLFGLVGYPMAKYSSLSPLAMLAIASASGLAAATGMVFLIAGWAVPSAAREVEDERFILQGHFAHVVRAIMADQPGEIEFEHEGKRQTLAARGLDGREVPQGADVVIERVEDGVAYVELWSKIAQQLKLPQ